MLCLKKKMWFYILLWKLLLSINSTLWISLHPLQDIYLISFKSCIVYDHTTIYKIENLLIRHMGFF